MATRSIWKGSVTFGLVHIPVVLYPAERRTELHFHLLDSRDNARVRYERINSVTGQKVPWDKVVKAYEHDENNYIVLNEEELKRVAPERTQAVEIESFVEEGAIDHAYFDAPYCLVPDKRGEKGYVLLREALRQAHRIGIARVVLRTREHLAALMAKDKALMLNLLRFQEELVDLAEFNLPGADIKQYKISPAELKMAHTLVDSMSATWQPESYRDDYRDRVLAWIDKRIEQGESAEPPSAEEAASHKEGVINIMDLLKKSVQEKKHEPQKRRRHG